MDIPEERQDEIKEKLERMSKEELRKFINKRFALLRGNPEKQKEYLNLLLDAGCSSAELEEMSLFIESGADLDKIEDIKLDDPAGEE